MTKAKEALERIRKHLPKYGVFDDCCQSDADTELLDRAARILDKIESGFRNMNGDNDRTRGYNQCLDDLRGIE